MLVGDAAGLGAPGGGLTGAILCRQIIRQSYKKRLQGNDA